MYTQTLLVLGFAAWTQSVLAAECNADNCARAIGGTFRGLRTTGMADCSTNLICTVTPATVTLTSIITETPAIVTATAGIPTVQITATEIVTTLAPIVKRQVSIIDTGVTNCPTALPSYASACSGTVRYYSACSCLGVTGSTATLAAPSITIISTLTLPPVTTIVPASTTITQITTLTQTTLIPTTTSPATNPCQSGFSCGNTATLQTCGVNAYCFTTSEGFQCGVLPTCNAPTCTTAADCSGANPICITSSCCPKKICSNGPSTSINRLAVSRIFGFTAIGYIPEPSDDSK